MRQKASDLLEQEPKGPFQKVAAGLYRHRSSEVYYALAKRAGKQYRLCLRTFDGNLAERQLGEFRQKVGRLEQRRTLER